MLAKAATSSKFYEKLIEGYLNSIQFKKLLEFLHSQILSKTTNDPILVVKQHSTSFFLV